MARDCTLQLPNVVTLDASGFAHVRCDGHRAGPWQIQIANMVMLPEVLDVQHSKDVATMTHGNRTNVGLDVCMNAVHGMLAFRVSRDSVCLQACSSTSRWAMLIGLSA